LARSLGLPMLVGARDALALLHDDDPDFDALRDWAIGALGEDRVRSAPRAPAALAEAVAAALRRLG
ncbi:MAG: hypothetical protein AAFU61_17790, partial [Pseudomonadota bacterium]